MGALQRGWDLVSGKVARESKERFEEAQRIVDIKACMPIMPFRTLQ